MVRPKLVQQTVVSETMQETGSEGTVTGAKGAPDTSLKHPEAPQDVRSLRESGQKRGTSHWGQEGRWGESENKAGNNTTDDYWQTERK